MNTKLTDINELIEICEELVNHIQQYGSIDSTRGSGYPIYEKYYYKIDTFDDKYNICMNKPTLAEVIKCYLPKRVNKLCLMDAKYILKTIIELKHSMFPNDYEMMFLSHCSKDKEQVDAFVQLLNDIGIPVPKQNEKNMIFYSSHDDYGVKNCRAFDENIKSIMQSHYHTIYIFWYTDYFFKSIACMNEVGAVWVLDKPYYEIFHPDLKREDTKGLLNDRKISFVSTDKNRLNNFKGEIERMFDLTPITTSQWEIKRDEYIQKINKIVEKQRKEEKLNDISP